MIDEATLVARLPIGGTFHRHGRKRMATGALRGPPECARLADNVLKPTGRKGAVATGKTNRCPGRKMTVAGRASLPGRAEVRTDRPARLGEGHRPRSEPVSGNGRCDRLESEVKPFRRTVRL